MTCGRTATIRRALPVCTSSALAAFVLLYAGTAYATAPENDNRTNATVIPDLPFTVTENTVDATTDPDDPDCYGTGPTVWYSFTPTADTTIRVFADTFGSSYDTTLSIYTEDVQIGCNDDAGSPQSGFLFEAVGGVTYDIMVGSFFGGPGGVLQFSLEEVSPLDIEVTLDPAGKADPGTGLATLSGTVFCSYPNWVDIYGYLKEKLNHVFISGDFGATSVYCTGETAWTSPAFPAYDGLFKGGKASAEISAYAYNNFESDEDHITQAVKLGGGGKSGGGGAQCTEKTLPAPEVGTAAFCSAAKTFADAEADCVARDGQLLSIHDPVMQNFAFTVASGIQYADWWIGLNDRAEEGVFLWTDGSPVDFTQWADGEPNNAGGIEDCVHLTQDNGGPWNDLPCEEQHPYICRLP